MRHESELAPPGKQDQVRNNIPDGKNSIRKLPLHGNFSINLLLWDQFDHSDNSCA